MYVIYNDNNYRKNMHRMTDKDVDALISLWFVTQLWDNKKQVG